MLLALLLLVPGTSCVVDGGCEDTDCDEDDEVDDLTESDVLEKKEIGNTIMLLQSANIHTIYELSIKVPNKKDAHRQTAATK